MRICVTDAVALLAGGKNHANELRSDALKRIRASDNQLITKEHFTRMDVDKCQTGIAYDQSASGPIVEYDYSPNAAMKEQKSYFMDKSYYNPDQRNRPCDAYVVDGSNGTGPPNSAPNSTDKNNHSHENDFDDSVSMNGDSYVVSSSASTDHNRLNSGGHRSAKRKHGKDESGPAGDSDANTVFHKMYKNNCGDMMQNKFDYLNNFDGIRPRNIDEMQVDATDADYRNMSSDMNSGRCGGGSDDGAANINVNYASSDDLNQTNTSELDDKNLSGSDDESGGKNCNHLFSRLDIKYSHNFFAFRSTRWCVQQEETP